MQFARLLVRPRLFLGGNSNLFKATLPAHSYHQLHPFFIQGREFQVKLPVLFQGTSYQPVKRFPSVVGLATAAGCVNLLSGSVVKCEGGCQTSVFIPSVQENCNEWSEGHPPLLIWLRRLWVPMLVVMTVAMGWHYPLSLTVNLVFLLWSTKPTPSSIYIWVEQKRLHAAQHKYGLDRLKAQWSNASMVMHVEVRDYVLFCLAQVSSLTQKMVVLGLLGDWWVIFSSSSSITGLNFGSLFPVSPSHEWFK